MDDDDIYDEDLNSQEPFDEWRRDPAKRIRESMLNSRRRIEDLQELRRMRELLGDDEFNLDFN